MENKKSENFTKDDFEKFMKENEEKMRQLLLLKSEEEIVDGLKNLLRKK